MTGTYQATAMFPEDGTDLDAIRYRDAYEQEDAADDGRDPWEYSPTRGDVCRECGEWFEVGNFTRRLCCVCVEEV